MRSGARNLLIRRRLDLDDIVGFGGHTRGNVEDNFELRQSVGPTNICLVLSGHSDPNGMEQSTTLKRS